MNNLSGIRLFLLAGVLFVLAGCSAWSDTAVGPQLVVDTAVTEELLAPVSPVELAPAIQEIPPTPLSEGDFAAVLAQEAAFVAVYEKVNPAVVHIGVNGGQGSGFVYDTQGHIVTNNHVVEGARTIVVTFANGQQLPAELVGRDPSVDLAVIRVNPNGQALTAVEMADSDTLRVGQLVVAIGSPFGLESSMTTGVISALNRLFPAEGSNGMSYQIPNIIQTDAAINPGNSGGPLLDIYGRVIGVNSAIESPVRGSSGIGYAIPANIVQAVVPQLIGGGAAQHPYLGLSGIVLTAEVAQRVGLPTNLQGIYVSTVVAGGPAATAGLQGGGSDGAGGDVITSIDGQPITEFDDLLGYLLQHTAVGQTVELQVLRNGTLYEVPVVLQARPGN